MYDSISFFRRLGAITLSNKARYCLRHNYHLVVSTPHNTSGILRPVTCTPSLTPDASNRCWEPDTDFDIDHSRAPTFGKIKLALAACRGRDNAWLLWSDADAMVVNQTVPLQTIIDDGYDLIFAYDWLMMNAGMLLIKCSPWAKSFLQTVYDARKFDKARALDQSSIQEHIDNLTDAERNDHVKVIPKYAMNVYTEEYRPGDFLLHFAGKLYEATEPGLVAIAQQFDVLSMADDIEDVAAFFRGTRLLNYYSGTCKVDPGEKQAHCKPEDSRRVLLNESLGSMSTPNRYRHVGLRYYWLGDWKDKYDVPGWNDKRKSLPMPITPPAGKEMPPIPLSEIHAAHIADGILVNEEDLREADKSMGAPEVEHEVEMEPRKDGGEEGEQLNEDDHRGSGWVSAFSFVLVISGIGAGIFWVRRRGKKSSKVQ